MSPGTTGRDFLLEIGTEEIPARMVDAALAELAERMRALIGRARLAPEGAAPAIRTYGTPRRLALLCPGLRAVQPDETVEVAGPPVKAAFDPAGRPTAAG
ncbi:MAG TPA: glycine--tRNA ligase subunit beta, partial [Candidatus Methylomirabilis sp.]|nr:glycine--tRNA ligase subunit beta [Candidatus Methylomirabilis sp.]